MSKATQKLYINSPRRSLESFILELRAVERVARKPTSASIGKMETYNLTSRERKRLIGRISHSSGIARYALEAKMSDEQVVKAAKNLQVLSLIKSSNTYNRHCQAQKTADANQRLKQFIDVRNSEIYQAGQWLFNCLSRTGQDRKNSLLEKDLVHKEDYNFMAADLHETVSEQQSTVEKELKNAEQRIDDLQSANDSFRRQLQVTRQYIEERYGFREWNEISTDVTRNILKASSSENS